jgi:hypothetical protein
MARPSRAEVFDPDEVAIAHVFNRTVRRSFLVLITRTGVTVAFMPTAVFAFLLSIARTTQPDSFYEIGLDSQIASSMCSLLGLLLQTRKCSDYL